MATEYSGPATLHTNDRVLDVQAHLSTDVSGGAYSWGGRLTTSDVAALGARGQGGTLTLSVPPVAADVHVVHAELADSGILLRVDGGRAGTVRTGRGHHIPPHRGRVHRLPTR